MRKKAQRVPEGDWYFVFDTEDPRVFDFFDEAEEAQAYVHELLITNGYRAETISVVKGRWLGLTAGFVEPPKTKEKKHG